MVNFHDVSRVFSASLHLAMHKITTQRSICTSTCTRQRSMFFCHWNNHVIRILRQFARNVRHAVLLSILRALHSHCIHNHIRIRIYTRSCYSLSLDIPVVLPSESFNAPYFRLSIHPPPPPPIQYHLSFSVVCFLTFHHTIHMTQRLYYCWLCSLCHFLYFHFRRLTRFPVRFDLIISIRL